MKNIKLFSLVLASVAIIYSCKKKTTVDDSPNNNPGNKTKQDLLSQKNWKISALTSGATDFWALAVPSCNKDDQYRFRKDDSLVRYDMLNKCVITDPDSSISFYKLYNSDSKLILYLKLGSIIIDDTADIDELNENSLRVNAKYSGLPAAISFTHP